jgi:Rieske Fe-S protein/mono/diheme cytochrome c family protein
MKNTAETAPIPSPMDSDTSGLNSSTGDNSMKSPPPIRAGFATIALLLLTVGIVWGDQTAEPGASASNGSILFRLKCSSCHTIGGGRLVGPDLKGVTSSRPHDWLEHFISAPDRMIASGDPTANQLLKQYGGVQMPNLGLTSAQVESLLAYLSQTGPQGRPTPPAAQAPASAGGADRGEEYFTGTLPLRKGGAPCLACHSLAGIAPLGGGTVGPDLTGIFDQMGTGLGSVLAILPFPTMKPIYESRPLSPQEQGDLLALFRSAAGKKATSTKTPIIVAVILLAAILLLMLAGLIWRGRLRVVHDPLLRAKVGRGSAAALRRDFLKKIAGVFACLCAAGLAIPFLVSLIAPVLRTRKSRWAKVGKLPPLTVNSPVNMSYSGRTEDAYVREPVTRDVWVTKLPTSDLVVYSPICPHLGCHYDWDAASGHFACPCHGSVFGVDGRVLGGPAPRPLDTLPARVENEELFIQWEQFEPGIREKKLI